MYRITIITHPISDVEGSHFKTIEVDADQPNTYADTIIFSKGGELVFRAPLSGVIIEKVK